MVEKFFTKTQTPFPLRHYSKIFIQSASENDSLSVRQALLIDDLEHGKQSIVYKNQEPPEDYKSELVYFEFD